MRSLALGCPGPRRTGGAVEGGEVFDAGGEVGHCFKNNYPFLELCHDPLPLHDMYKSLRPMPC